MKRLASIMFATMMAMSAFALPAAAAAGPGAEIKCGNHRTMVLGMVTSYWGNCTDRKVALDVYLVGSGGETFSHEACVEIGEDKRLGMTPHYVWYVGKDTGETC